jgi:hypothetical protein
MSKQEMKNSWMTKQTFQWISRVSKLQFSKLKKIEGNFFLKFLIDGVNAFRTIFFICNGVKFQIHLGVIKNQRRNKNVQHRHRQIILNSKCNILSRVKIFNAIKNEKLYFSFKKHASPLWSVYCYYTNLCNRILSMLKILWENFPLTHLVLIN